MPLILGANSVSGYTVKNSLRFNSGSSDNLSKVFSSAETSNKIGTLSFWFKTLGTDQQYLVATNTGTIFYIYFNSSTGITFQNGVTTTRFTSQVFRDPSAWYHLVVAWDTSQGTASNRQKMYLNGSEITAFSTSNNLSLNQVIPFFDNDGSTKHIGSYTGGGYYSGYISEFYGIDGQQLTPSSFGETDTDTGIWKPKAYSGTYGTNGFKLEFKNSASLGTDTSGNGNNFTVNNLTSIDQTTDTPTNNFATLNPLDTQSNVAGAVISEGNTVIDYGTAASVSSSIWGTIGVNTGKWYAEFNLSTYSGSSNLRYGFVKFTEINGATKNVSATGIFMVALDLNNSLYWLGTNGVWDAGDPSAGTGGNSLTPSADFYTITVRDNSNTVGNGGTWKINTGNPAFTIVSGNADANGYGNFEYAVPSGYYALCTKNLANFG